jgi:purine-cytosine permease-like protein
MSDGELNAEVARLQSQPDGLMAAMALIEAQNLLRQQDSFAYSQWQLQAQMQAASAPAVSQEPTPVIAEPVVPEPVAAQIVTPEPAITSYPVQSIPEPTPAVTNQPNVDDVVAALNRNYASAATEAPEPSTPQQSLDVAVAAETSERTASETTALEPDPVTSVLLTSSETSSEFESEATGTEESETAVNRTRTAGALVWSWISLASTPLILVLAAFLKESGASFAQSVLVMAALIIATSTLVGIGAVAAKRGSSAIGVVSRAAFGVWGNIFPAIVMLVVKISWSIALLILGVRMLSPLVSNQPWFSTFSTLLIFPDEFNAVLLTAVPIVFIASLIAGFGGITMLRTQQITAVFSIIGLAGIAYFVFSSNSISSLKQGAALEGAALLDLALLCFALFGFTAFSQSGDFARKLPVETPGAKVFFLSFVSALIIPVAAGVMGVLWIFMSEESFGVLLTDQFISTIAGATPIWVFIAFVVAVGLSILQLTASSLYSLSGGIFAVGAKLPGGVAVSLASVLLLSAVLVASALIATSSLLSLLIELIVIATVIAASYTGIVLADSLIRSRDYHEVSLTRDYGFYGRFNFANSIGFVLASVVGFGYVESTGLISSWTGYLGNFTPAIFEVAGSNIGIAMAFGLAVLFPVLFGIPKIKGQERKLVELDERREELKEYLDTAK